MRKICKKTHLCHCKMVLDTIIDGVVVINKTGMIQSINPATEKLFGYTSEELEGENISILMPEPFKSAHDGYLQQYFETKQARVIGVGGEVVGLHKDGQPLVLWLRVEVFETTEGILFVGVLRDLTLQKGLIHAKEMAESANRAKSGFLIKMSHELRTPMHAIRSFANMALKKSIILMECLEKIDDPEKRAYVKTELHLDPKDWGEHTHLWLKRILTNQERQLHQINSLLDLEKLELGLMDFRFQQGDVQQIVQEGAKELETLIQEKELTLRISSTKVDTKVFFDKERILQVIRNVLGNAIKFAPERTIIFVSFKEDHSKDEVFVGIIIRDEGGGIPENELDMVFGKFSQSSKNSQSRGTGLGLAICREIMVAHRGTIRANNHPEGGAIFTIRLPKDHLNTKEEKGESLCTF